MSQFLVTFLTISFFSLIPLAVYAYRKTGGDDFSWIELLRTSRNRLYVQFTFNLFAAFAVTMWPESRSALSATLNLVGGLVGIVVPITAANDFLIGLLNGGFCVIALQTK
jgi:hypothetical protein